MANEIQRLYWGSQASPIVNANIEDGTYTLTLDAETTVSINYNGSQNDIQNALYDLVAIGTNNISATQEVDGWTLEFIGAAADTNFSQLSASSSLKQKADGVSFSNTQSGVADVAITANNNITTSAVSPVDEVQNITVGSNAGNFDLNGTTVTVTGIGSDSGAIQAACDSVFGYGNTSVTGADPYTITFQGSLAATDISQISITNDFTSPGGVSSGTITDGVAGVHQQETCTFSGTPTAGAMDYGGYSLPYNTDASSAGLSGVSSSGTPDSGTIITTWSDYDSHTAIPVSSNTLQIPGQPQIILVELTDSPTEGQLIITIDGNNSSNFNYNDSTPGAITGWSGMGSAGNWTYTNTINAADTSSYSASDGTGALLKSASIEIVTIQDGIATIVFPEIPNANLFNSFIQGL